MQYENGVIDFVRRTRVNLNFILKSKDVPGVEVYETTQLVNSLLGLLVFPREEFIRRLDTTSLADLEADGWPIPRVAPDFDQAAHLKQLVDYLRHAVAHYNLEFHTDPSGEIRSVVFWNDDPRQGHRTVWKAEMSIGEIDAFTKKFLCYLETFAESHLPARGH